jgi:hypothetical protein
MIHVSGTRSGLSDADPNDVVEWLSNRGFGEQCCRAVFENDLEGVDMLELTTDEISGSFGIENPDKLWMAMHSSGGSSDTESGGGGSKAIDWFQPSFTADDVFAWMLRQGVAASNSHELDGKAMLALDADGVHALLGFPEVSVREDFIRKLRATPFDMGGEPEQVTAWLESQGFPPQIVSQVAKHGLDAMDLYGLSNAEFKEELLVSDPGDRWSLFKAIHVIM